MPRKPSVFVCQECMGVVKDGPAGYHPWLYCELVKLGHPDPEAYLRTYGFVRQGGDASERV